MRKVSSAPTLFHLANQSATENQQPHFSRAAKQATSNAHGKLATTGFQWDAIKRQGSEPSRLRDCRTRVLPLGFVDSSKPEPPDQAITEEFAESARGLAGLECFELYGPQRQAPELRQRSVQNLHPLNSEEKSQSDRREAFASCLATPLTGQERNLGELVESEARELMQAGQNGILQKYEQEFGTPQQGEMLKEEEMRTEESICKYRRKRRLAERLGLVISGKREKWDTQNVFDDCPEVEQLIKASLDESHNTIEVGPDYVCIGELCFPIEEVDESLFPDRAAI